MTTQNCDRDNARLFDRELDADPEENPTSKKWRIRHAKNLCSTCPAKNPCLEVGVAGGESGVWGGVLLKDGKASKPQRRAAA